MKEWHAGFFLFLYEQIGHDSDLKLISHIITEMDELLKNLEGP